MGAFAGSLLLLTALTYVPAPTASDAVVHPYHKSLAEIEFDRARGHLEVSFWIWPTDLAEELTAREGKKVDLDKTPKLDDKIQAWLGDVFRIRDAKKQRKSIKWVGKDLKLESCWLYFEIPVGKDARVLELENRAFFAIAKSPIHTTTFVQGKKRSVRNLTRRSPRWTLPVRAPSKPAKRDKPAPEAPRPEAKNKKRVGAEKPGSRPPLKERQKEPPLVS